MRARGLEIALVIVLSVLSGSVYGGTEGSSNTLFGSGAGTALGDDDDFATFVGYQAGFNTNDGSEPWHGKSNTFVGYQSGFSNDIGQDNVFVGDSAGYANTLGIGNTFIGNLSGFYNTTGYDNAFLGYSAGFFNTEGYTNTFLGAYAGTNNTTGILNVYIGHSAGYNETGSNKLYIANSDTSSPLIYGEFDNKRMTINGNLEVVGPDNGLIRLSNVTADNTAKGARMVLNHYSNAQEPVYLFGAYSGPNDSFIAFGGGNPVANAATQIDLFTAETNTTPVGSPRMTIKSNGYVGIGTQTPSYPLQMAGGAYSTGGTWVNGSSRECKENIESLETGEAFTTLASLAPVKFNYKSDATDKHLGFIAEDVPDLVATKDRKGLSPMDIVAVLTKVLQEQQKLVQEQQRAISAMREELNELKGRKGN